mmetsp:Transcript_23246/g.37094  ORF Transcript_23246/g.37094 Transcript_23246/m.37094 type:complete len:371 (-) Transcript_23246:79-1191(-)
MMALAHAYISLTVVGILPSFAKDTWEACDRIDPSCQLTFEGDIITEAASISLLQHRGVPTKINYNTAISPAVDIQDAVARLRKEEADAEKTLADLQNSISAKESRPEQIAARATSLIYTPPAEPSVAHQDLIEHDLAASLRNQYLASPTGMEGKPEKIETRKEKVAPSLADQSQRLFTSSHQQASQPRNSAQQFANSFAYGSSQSAPAESIDAPSRPRTSGIASEYYASLLQSKSQEQGSSALVDRLISAELAQTQAMLAIQARQDELEERETELEALTHRFSSGVTCAAFKKNGCGPITDSQTCGQCCSLSEGLMAGQASFKGSSCSCIVAPNRYRTICSEEKNSSSTKEVVSILSFFVVFATIGGIVA